MKLASLRDLFVDQLRDLHSAEQLCLKALPKFAKAAKAEPLRTALEEHCKETESQAERLERIFAELGAMPGGKKSQAMVELIGEAKAMTEVEALDPVRDAALIAAVQRIEHYEIAGYGSVRTFAQVLGSKVAAELLQETLDEEAAADQKLSEIAHDINARAQAAI